MTAPVQISGPYRRKVSTAERVANVVLAVVMGITGALLLVHYLAR
jgi:hypothetical protein